MKLIVGLGNPGEEYKNNRHNVGFMVLDKLVGQGSWNKNKSGQVLYFWLKKGRSAIELVKPQSFMNSSGQAILYIKSKHLKMKADDMYVVHDDLDIRFGEYKIQKGKGPKDHKGLNSIYDSLGTDAFWHVRIGVDNREKENRIPGETYVLQDFKNDELTQLGGVINEVCKKLETL